MEESGTFIILEHPRHGWRAGVEDPVVVGHYKGSNPDGPMLHAWEEFLVKRGGPETRGVDRTKSLVKIPLFHLNIHRLRVSDNDRPLVPVFFFNRDEYDRQHVSLNWCWRRSLFPESGEVPNPFKNPLPWFGSTHAYVEHTFYEKTIGATSSGERIPAGKDKEEEPKKEEAPQEEPKKEEPPKEEPKEEGKGRRRNLLDALTPKKKNA